MPKMIPRYRLKQKRLKLVLSILVITVVIWVVIMSKSTPQSWHLTKDMKTSLQMEIQTWFNLAHIADTQAGVSGNVTEYFGQPVPWEEDMLSMETVKDDLLFSNALTSKIVLLNGNKDRVHFREGDTIQVRVDLYNGYGKPQQNGSDDVKVWANELNNHKSLLARVTDLKNGSYAASFVALFSGNITVNAALIHSVRYRKDILSSVRQGVRQYVAGLFRDGSHSEVTLCGPSPVFPNYTALCNFTSENNDMPWYCGHPHNNNLSCENWASVRALPLPKFPSWLHRQSETSTLLRLFPAFIPASVKISVREKKLGQSLGLSSCTPRSRPVHQSWLEHSPRGWFDGNTWHPYACDITNLSKQTLSRCLNDTHILIYGSSVEAVAMFQELKTVTGCRQQMGLYPVCYTDHLGVTVRSHPFAHPLYTQSAEWIPKTVASSVLHSIPKTGHLVILIDHTIPSALQHHSEYRSTVREMMKFVRHILDKYDIVLVAVMGPDAGHGRQLLQKENSFNCNDCFALRFFDILKEEYAELRKKVLYLDGWDMTSLKNHLDSLSAADIWREKIKLLFNYVCDGFQ